jgi:hypothetical protein
MQKRELGMTSWFDDTSDRHVARLRRARGASQIFTRAARGSRKTSNATGGDNARARLKFSEMLVLGAKRYIDLATSASVYASLGEVDLAVRFYQKAVENRPLRHACHLD